MKLTTLVIGMSSLLVWGSSVQAETRRIDQPFDFGPISREELRPRRPVVPVCRNLPDLIVSTIVEPVWNARSHQTTIAVVVKNKGQVVAENFRVQLKDGATIRTAFVTAVGPESSHTIYFTLPYWVYNPEADFKVHADSTNRVRECSETNNVKEFFGLG